MCCQKVELTLFIQVRLLRFMLPVVFMMESFLMDSSINICSVLLTELGGGGDQNLKSDPLS